MDTERSSHNVSARQSARKSARTQPEVVVVLFMR